MLGDLHKAQWMLADRGYDADWYRRASGKRHKALHSATKIPERAITYDKGLYRSRSRIEIIFGRLKDWRRVAPATIDAQRSSSPLSRLLPP
ncbi:transposase [Sphingomonas glacialis]|uniref:transposase n=1 Tax=Sphingomonas glacialis TaxID=658225 RepID=UPI003D691059